MSQDGRGQAYFRVTNADSIVWKKHFPSHALYERYIESQLRFSGIHEHLS